MSRHPESQPNPLENPVQQLGEYVTDFHLLISAARKLNIGQIGEWKVIGQMLAKEIRSKTGVSCTSFINTTPKHLSWRIMTSAGEDLEGTHLLSRTDEYSIVMTGSNDEWRNAEFKTKRELVEETDTPLFIEDVNLKPLNKSQQDDFEKATSLESFENYNQFKAALDDIYIEMTRIIDPLTGSTR